MGTDPPAGDRRQTPRDKGPLKGLKPADRRVRVERPHSPYFRYTGPGQLVAKPAANDPKTGFGRAWNRVRAVLIGRPLASEEEIG